MAVSRRRFGLTKKRRFLDRQVVIKPDVAAVKDPDRVLVVCDGDNCVPWLQTQSVLRARLLLDYLLDGRTLVEAGVFLSQPPRKASHRELKRITRLALAGYTVMVRSGCWIEQSEGPPTWKGYRDEDIVQYCFDQLPRYDVVVLLTRDNDFAELIRRLKIEHRKSVELAGVVSYTSLALRSAADRCIDLSHFKQMKYRTVW